MVCLEEHMTEFGTTFEGCDERLRKRPADSFDESRRRRGIHAEKTRRRKGYSKATAVLPTVDPAGNVGEGGGSGRRGSPAHETKALV